MAILLGQAQSEAIQDQLQNKTLDRNLQIVLVCFYINYKRSKKRK